MIPVWRRASPLLVATALSLFLALVPSPFPQAPVKTVANATQALGHLLGAVYLFGAARRFEPGERARTGWCMLAAATLSNFVGFALFGVLEYAGFNNPFPSVADLFWVLAYPLSLLGILLLARHYLGSGLPMQRPTRALFATALSLLLVAWFLLVPLTRDSSHSWLERSISALYPICNALLIGAGVYMAELTASFGRGALRWPWLAIVAGAVLTGVTDITYSLFNIYDLYQTGSYLDQGWTLSGLLMGLGGLLQWRIMTHEVRAGGDQL